MEDPVCEGERHLLFRNYKLIATYMILATTLQVHYIVFNYFFHLRQQQHRQQ